jgi:hypothetical protein
MKPQQKAEFTKKLEARQLDAETVYDLACEVPDALLRDVLPKISDQSEAVASKARVAAVDISSLSLAALLVLTNDYELQTGEGAFLGEEVDEALSKLAVVSKEIAKRTNKIDELTEIRDNAPVKSIIHACALRSTPFPNTGKSIKALSPLVDFCKEQTEASMDLIALLVLQQQKAGTQLVSTEGFDKKMIQVIERIDYFTE